MLFDLFKSWLSDTKNILPRNSLINILLTGSVLMYICFIKISQYLWHKRKTNPQQFAGSQPKNSMKA